MMDSKGTPMQRRAFLLSSAATTLVACAPRGTFTLDPAAAKIGVVEPIYLATSRSPTDPPAFFDNGRDAHVSFARFDISIPPDRETGSVNFPGDRKPNPERDMLTVEAMIYANPEAFRRSLGQSIRKPGTKGVVNIFVHGFNTNTAEAVYRLAQMAHDIKMTGTFVQFAWPSLGNAFGYVHDRDSAVFSRDALEETIEEVAKAGARSIILMAHSMGTYLAMETMRQMAIRGTGEGLRKIDSVVLISPDIDVDVFHSQMRSIEHPPEPFVIFGSRRDKALKLSSLLVAEPARLGNLKDPSVLADLPVTYVDIDAFRDGTSHFAVATSPELIEVLNGFANADAWLARDERRTANPLHGLLLTAGEATQVVLGPVNAIGGAMTTTDGTMRTYEVPADATPQAPPTRS